MSTTLTLKQTVASVWQKFMEIVGHESIKGIGDGTLTGAITELNSNITNLLPQYNLFSNGTSAEVQYMQIPKKKLCIVFIQVYNDVKNNAVITQLPTPTSTVIKRTVGKHVDNTMGRIRFTVSSSGQLIMGCEEFDKAVKATSISFMYEYA